MLSSAHIGHNKFTVYVSGGKAQAVLAGSTNWTVTGLCAQSNNSVLIEDGTVARFLAATHDARAEDDFDRR